MKRLIVTVFALFAVFSISPAEARKFHHRHHTAAAIRYDARCDLTDNARTICGSVAFASGPRIIRGNSRFEIVADQGSVLGARPEGCPHAYCGCGLRKYLGLADKRLNLARNWARVFPRVGGPAAGVAAVRAGHVMYIEAAAADGQWLVRDYNSGGGLSRLHLRDVRGYIFVNPHGGGSAG